MTVETRNSPKTVARRDWAAALGAGVVVFPAAAAVAVSPPGEAPVKQFRGGADSRSETSIISVNNAEAAAFTDLPGMYPTVASRIVDFVRREGPLKSFDDLLATEVIVQGNERVIAILKKNQERLSFK